MTPASSANGATPIDGDAPLEPAAMLALSESQQRSVQSKMGGFVPIITGTWAGAWLIGFLALWSIDGLDGGLSLPLPLAIVVFVAVMLIAIAASTWLGIRSSRGIKSSRASDFTGAVYGSTWWVGSVGLGAIGGGLATQGMSSEIANFYYPAIFVLFSGVMYMVAGAIWHAVPPVVMGVVIVAIAAASSFFPYPTHFLFLALAGGGAFAILTIVSAVYMHRAAPVSSDRPQGSRAAHA